MNTVTISKKEYNALVFARNKISKNENEKPDFKDKAFGIMKSGFSRVATSAAYVNKLRRSWRA